MSLDRTDNPLFGIHWNSGQSACACDVCDAQTETDVRLPHHLHDVTSSRWLLRPDAPRILRTILRTRPHHGVQCVLGPSVLPVLSCRNSIGVRPCGDCFRQVLGCVSTLLQRNDRNQSDPSTGVVQCRGSCSQVNQATLLLLRNLSVFSRFFKEIPFPCD